LLIRSPDQPSGDRRKVVQEFSERSALRGRPESRRQGPTSPWWAAVPAIRQPFTSERAWVHSPPRVTS